MKLFDKTRIPLLETALNAYALRNKVSAANIANVNTVGYKSKRVTFEEELAGAMNSGTVTSARTDSRHIPLGNAGPHENAAQVIEDRSGPGTGTDELASGVNNVDIDQEMSELAKNQIRFRFAARLMSESFKGIQKSIRGQV
ncbi:MAG: flagellar basal body rod protein FlgB [Ignavibacteria bacterium]|nr:flagellar basal body rod protein FlgB [Ignavibacteria bacterium]